MVIGASGGVDSALCAAIYARVVGAGNVLLANLPSRHNSRTTITLARQLAERLGTYYTEVPIEESVRHTCAQIDGLVCKQGGADIPVCGDSRRQECLRHLLSLSPLAVENVQARDRSGRVLAALASAWGGVFTCNANKSEMTIGYGTMYGDLAGFFAALADLWKTEVWELAECYNREVFGGEVIPRGSIDLVPSAELGPDQNVDEGKGDPLHYPWHDKLFASWTEGEVLKFESSKVLKCERSEVLKCESSKVLKFESSEVLKCERSEVLKCVGGGGSRGHSPSIEEDTERLWLLYRGLARYKRLQAPPVLSLKNRTFGFDLR